MCPSHKLFARHNRYLILHAVNMLKCVSAIEVVLSVAVVIFSAPRGSGFAIESEMTV